MFNLAIKQLLREWRSGELYVLFFAIVVAVAAVSSVNFFTDRIHLALKTQANELLGADLVISDDQVFSNSYFDKAEELNLEVVRQLSFPTMVMTENAAQLSWLKVVESGFPLRGKLGVSQKLFSPEIRVDHAVESGKIWLEPRLISALNLSVGDVINLGEKEFTIDGILMSEPGRGGDLFNIAPRVLMNYVDINETKLIQAGSRVNYTLLVAGDARNINRFRSFINLKNETGVRVQGIEDARPEIRLALSRAEQFLGLAALTSVILAGIAIALAARRFASTHLDHCAIMRCIGATQKTIFNLYFLQIIYIGIIASVTGVLAGYLFHEVLISLLGTLVGVSLPAPSISPAIFGAATGIVTLLGFALPPIVSLKSVPALRVLKRELGEIKIPGIASYLIGVVALAVIMVAQSRDVKMGLYMVGGALLTVAILAIVAIFILYLIRHFRYLYKTPLLFGLRNLIRRPASTVIQIVAFGLGIMALLVLTLIRGDLLDQWQASIPTDAPNRFAINIQKDQANEIKVFFNQQNEKTPTVYPMIRGRLVEINGKKVDEESFEKRGAKQLLSRELNLSWAKELESHNTLIKGEWWNTFDIDSPEFSVEKSVSENLGITIGDKLGFQIADQFVEAKITNIREVDWGSFRANFYVIASPGLLDQMPTTYMSPFHLDVEKFVFLNELVAEFPNVTIIDVAAIMTHVRKIIERVTMAVEYIFMFTVLSGFMVLLAGIQATHDERMLENAISRTVGGSKRQIYSSLIVEFLSLGVLSGFVAALLATVIGAALSRFVLDMPLHWDWSLWAIGLIGGGIGVAAVGLWGSRKVVTQPPLVTLKNL